MRDRLEMLQTINEAQEDSESEFYGSQNDIDKVDLTQEAVVFENTSVIDSILKEAHSIRKDISLLHLEVERLGTHNERFGTTVRRLSLLKQASDSIARGIHQRGEAIYARLQALGEQSSQLEEKEGPNSAASRITRTQYNTLTRAFHTAMAAYNEAEEVQREICRGRLQRQASIIGTSISDGQLDMLVDKGGEGWTELSQSLQVEGGRSSRWALHEIKGRHKELVELEARLKEVHDLFQHMAMVVEEQGSMLNNIEANVSSTEEYIDKVNVEIKRALQYKKKNPCLQCCPCLPCWRGVM